MSGPPAWVVIGNAGSRRVAGFAAALARLGLPPPRLIPYPTLLAGRVDWAQTVPPGAVVRIESPDRDWAVERAILARGAAQLDPEGGYAGLDAAAVAALPADPGAILVPRQWYRGWCALLAEIQQELAAAPAHQLMNAPADIAIMFDKRACHARLAEAGLPVPRALPPPRSFADLQAAMDEAGMGRVFIKPAHGSSASGVVAYQQAGERQQATTTVEMVPGDGGLRLYNSRRVRVYRDKGAIAALVDALCAHRVHVEAWVPKAGLAGGTCDLRVVMIAGRVRHVIVRLSNGPLTNLHLGNARLGLDALLPHLGAAGWAAAQRTCEQVAAQFPSSLYMGIDLLISAHYRGHAIAEVNAFGDLLYDTWDAGQDTYEAEICAVLEARAPIGSRAR